MNNITLTLEGTTKQLPFDPATARIITAMQVSEYDGDAYTTLEFVVVWSERGQVRATRIGDAGLYSPEWAVHPDALVLDLDGSWESIAEAVADLAALEDGVTAANG